MIVFEVIILIVLESQQNYISITKIGIYRGTVFRVEIPEGMGAEKNQQGGWVVIEFSLPVRYALNIVGVVIGKLIRS